MKKGCFFGLLLLCLFFSAYADDVMVILDQSSLEDRIIGAEQVFSLINAAVQANNGTVGIVRAGDFPAMVAPPNLAGRDLRNTLYTAFSAPVGKGRLGPAVEYAAEQLRLYMTGGTKRIYLITGGGSLRTSCLFLRILKVRYTLLEKI